MGHPDYTDAKFLWITILVFGLWSTYWGVISILERATADVNGRIVAVQLNCPQPGKGRCNTHYVIESLQGAGRSEYIAYAGGLTISPLLQTGSVVSKNRWKLEYRVNGNLVDEFPLNDCLGQIVLGLVGLVVAVVLRASKL